MVLVNKFRGIDDVAYESIQKNINTLAPTMTSIDNTCIRFQRQPQEWKQCYHNDSIRHFK